MFGNHWKPAQGTVVERRATHTTVDGSIPNHEFVVDVRTSDGETFRSQVPEPRIAADFMTPTVGQTVAVEYHPRSHDVRFDKSDPGLQPPHPSRPRAGHFDSNRDPNTAEVSALREAMARAMGNGYGFPGYPAPPGEEMNPLTP